jgi:hypothetical protein
MGKTSDIEKPEQVSVDSFSDSTSVTDEGVDKAYEIKCNMSTPRPHPCKNSLTDVVCSIQSTSAYRKSM